MQIFKQILSGWKKRTSEAAERMAATLPEYKTEVSVLTDPGCRRAKNEDCIRYVRPGDTGVLARKGLLAVVADGMGGHAAGEVASTLAVEVISRVYYADPREPYAALQGAFMAANRAIYQTSLQDERCSGMGTTCTALVLQTDRAFAAHVGDSRLYLVRNGKICLMTEDHTAVMQMVKAGAITSEAAQRHPKRHILTCALGTKPHVEVATWITPLSIHAGDVFVLCSDGLHDLVQDEEIKHIVLSHNTRAACERLIATAKARGGHDNITVGLLSVDLAGDRAIKGAR